MVPGQLQTLGHPTPLGKVRMHAAAPLCLAEQCVMVER